MYPPPFQFDQYYLTNIDKSLYKYSNHEKIELAGDFKAQRTDHYRSLFLYQHELTSIVKESSSLKVVLLVFA